VADIREA
jgi:hypothetical protein